MPVTENLSIYFNSVDGMAVSVIYTEKKYIHTSSKSIVLDGIFENEYVNINGVASLKPTLLYDESLLPDISNGDKMRIKGIDYYVRNIEPDGTGAAELILETIVNG